MIQDKKRILRKEMKSISFPFHTKKEREEIIIKQILKSESYLSCKTLLLFAGKGNEPDLSELFNEAVAQGKTVGYPKCRDNGIMIFCKVNNLSFLKTGKYGISEPDDTCEEITDFTDTLCIMPGVAFTKDCKRLGHGGGYYDRFLAKNSCKKIGVTFKEYILENIPTDENDITADEVIFA